MQRQPFLRLFETVVMEFVVDAAVSERIEQRAPDVFRKLTAVDCDCGWGRHAPVVAETER